MVIVGIILAFSVFITLLPYGVKAQESDEKVMTVEADVIVGSGGNQESNESIVSIQVPNYIHLENVTVGKLSGETKLIINNTGNIDVLLTAELNKPDDIIFRHLQLTNGSSTFRNIPEFITTIGTKRTLYMRLDLRYINETIEDDMIGETAQIKFIAMKA